jgi:deazaflavin-dependent oxidoreductase (nitroreductase family)
MALTGTYVPSKQQWVRDQVAEFEASDGARANTLRDTGDPIVVITSVGAKSGNLRKNPVMRVERDGTYVAVASKGGSDDNPEWYHNFVAHPEVELQDGAEKHTYAVRLVTGEERVDWWDYAKRTWPTYAEYEKRTEREIPVFVLERTD